MELNAVIEMLDRVELLRRERGISKTDMYTQSRTSSSAISQWRTGRTQPSQTSISNLAKVLGTSPEYLVYGIKKEPSPVQGGLSAKQLELIGLTAQLSDEDVSVLLAAARAQIASRTVPDDRQ